MKKFMSVLALLVAIVATSFATHIVPPTTESGSVRVREGRNAARLRDGSTLMFMSRGGEIGNVELRRSTGQLIKFEDDSCPTCGAQPPKPCKGETRCVYSEKHKATICFCMLKPVFGSAGGGTEAAMDYYLKIDTIEGESR